MLKQCLRALRCQIRLVILVNTRRCTNNESTSEQCCASLAYHTITVNRMRSRYDSPLKQYIAALHYRKASVNIECTNTVSTLKQCCVLLHCHRVLVKSIWCNNAKSTLVQCLSSTLVRKSFHLWYDSPAVVEFA